MSAKVTLHSFRQMLGDDGLRSTFEELPPWLQSKIWKYYLRNRISRELDQARPIRRISQDAVAPLVYVDFGHYNGVVHTKAFPRGTGQVMVLSITREGKIVIILEYRKVVGRIVVSLPTGGIETRSRCRRYPKYRDIRASGLRELRTEAGYGPSERTEFRVQWLMEDAGLIEGTSVLLIMNDVVKVGEPELEPGEDIREVRECDYSEFVRLVQCGEDGVVDPQNPDQLLYMPRNSALGGIAAMLDLMSVQPYRSARMLRKLRDREFEPITSSDDEGSFDDEDSLFSQSASPK